MLVVIFGPLLVFAPQLAAAKQSGLAKYGRLAERYVSEFDAKWLEAGAPADEALVGSADIQSLADLGNSFGLIREMKIFPFSQQQILQIAIISSLPGLPLIFLVMPVGEILQLLAGALL
jgi:hypothetical protein